MKITPSARVLRMLGEIEFDEWQCIAELIDNAFDDFTEIHRSGTPWAGGYRVSVELPDSAQGQLVITDTGRGMTYDRLERAVRAGWSGNDMHDKLGLFGMGFNVSTARLGKRTRVLTTRQGDTEWIGVEIDLDRIGDDFEAEDITEPKADPNEHGTRIVISRLHPTRARWLQKNGAALRNILGQVYSWIFLNRPFELWVGGFQVKPVRHCRWGDDRSVLYNNKERIPAYIEIDEKLENGLACGDCGQWQLTDRDACEDCGSDRLTVRERRVHGWLGIQRYMHKHDYGIDFLRNGRKILRWDKQLFTWRNPDGAVGNEEPEYPVDLAHQGGRIIGEIHLDHVPVTYQKDAFEYGDRSWRSAVEIVRGVAPLLPQRAANLEYEENTSPLARLFKGYRRNDAGLRYLVPGDGRNKPIHEDTRRWGQEFHRGNPDYQTDERWWQAVVDHEAAKSRGKNAKVAAATPGKPDEAAVMEALGFDGAETGGLGSVATGPDETNPGAQARPSTGDESDPAARAPEKRKETRQERVTRYMENSTTYPALSRSFGHPRVGFVEVEARRLTVGGLTDENLHPTPVLLDQRGGNALVAFLDLNHPIFQRFGADPADLLLAEIAVVLRVQTSSEWSHSELIAAIRAESLPASALDAEMIGAEAKELLAEVRRRMASELDRVGEPEKAFQFLSPDELTHTEHTMIANGKVTRTTDLGASGEFLLHVPALFLVRLVESLPSLFMDNRVFQGVYEGVASASARRLSLARTVGYLSDVATQATYAGASLPDQLLRTRLSIRLLADDLAEEK
ncbi:ATP-binding protein [Streptomyces albidoflavus]|uniref:ATP-binding protein n=1 Tax=Streptomyces albidoflavus TaxID=1886 RepID=UPI0004C831F4|nr:ATP-binding protein [Streptomyces albidoflavus]